MMMVAMAVVVISVLMATPALAEVSGKGRGISGLTGRGYPNRM